MLQLTVDIRRTLRITDEDYSQRLVFCVAAMQPVSLSLPGYQFVIVCMRTDPKPDEGFTFFKGKCSVIEGNPDGINLLRCVDFFETQAFMKRIALPQAKSLFGRMPNTFGQLVKQLAECPSRVRGHVYSQGVKFCRLRIRPRLCQPRLPVDPGIGQMPRTSDHRRPAPEALKKQWLPAPARGALRPRRMLFGVTWS